MTRETYSIPQEPLTAICLRYHVRELSLFGSALKENSRPDSDVDLLVEFDPHARIGFLSLAHLQRELSELLGRPVDLVPKGGLKPRIRAEVLAEAEVLFAA